MIGQSSAKEGNAKVNLIVYCPVRSHGIGGMTQFPETLYRHGVPDCHDLQTSAKNSSCLLWSVTLAAAVSLQCHIASPAEPATAWAGHSCSFLCSSQRRQIQISCYFSQVIQAEHIVTSDLKPICQKCQEIFNLKPSSYFVCNICDSFRHKLNRLDIVLSKTFNLHVTRGHLRSHSVAVKVLLCSMTSLLYVTHCFPDRNRSLECLVKKTELLENPSNGKCNHLPSQDHLIMFNALRSCVCKSSTKGSGRGAFPKHSRGGFLAETFFQMFYLSIHRSVAQSNLPHLL